MFRESSYKLLESFELYAVEHDGKYTKLIGPILPIPWNDEFHYNKVGQIKEFIQLSHISDKTCKTAIKHFLKGIEVIEWKNEAFLNIFKAVELISDKYFAITKDELKKSVLEEKKSKIDQLKNALENNQEDKIIGLCYDIYNIDRVVIKLKVKTAINELGLVEKYSDCGEEFVKLRNEVAAHASSKKEITTDQLHKYIEMSRDVVIIITEKLATNSKWPLYVVIFISLLYW